MYTFKITYIFIIYNLNTFFFLYLYFCTQYIIIIIIFFSYIGVILHPYCVIPMDVCTIMHVFIMSTKSGLIKTQIVYAVFIVS